ncbi:hypothetical protein D3C76_1668370 [compost metagenome]
MLSSLIRKPGLLVALALATLPGGAPQAAPAPWFQWQSLATGRYLCTQINPGDAWVKHSGPYNNAGCRR